MVRASFGLHFPKINGRCKGQKKSQYQISDQFFIFCHQSRLEISVYQNKETIECNVIFCFKPRSLDKNQTLDVRFQFNK